LFFIKAKIIEIIRIKVNVINELIKLIFIWKTLFSKSKRKGIIVIEKSRLKRSLSIKLISLKKA